MKGVKVISWNKKLTILIHAKCNNSKAKLIFNKVLLIIN